MNITDISHNKIKYEYGSAIKPVKATEKLWGYEYANLEEGVDDILIVRNYYPYYLYNMSKTDTIIELMSRGFEVNVTSDISEGDKIILKKPRSIRYIVKPMESLDIIAQKFGVDKYDIIMSNGLQSEKLFIGQIIWI